MFKIAKQREEFVREQIKTYIRSRYERIDVTPCQGLFNYKCFLNSVQYAEENEGHGVAEVMYVSDGWPVLHYLNTKDGEYLETTLGFLARNIEYYFVRKINPCDWRYIESEFDRSLESWLNQFTNAIDRKLLGITRVV